MRRGGDRAARFCAPVLVRLMVAEAKPPASVASCTVAVVAAFTTPAEFCVMPPLLASITTEAARKPVLLILALLSATEVPCIATLVAPASDCALMLPLSETWPPLATTNRLAPLLPLAASEPVLVTVMLPLLAERFRVEAGAALWAPTSMLPLTSRLPPSADR